MYKCCNVKKLIKLAVCDVFMIITAIIITAAIKATDKINDEIFLPVIMYHSIVSDECSGGEYQVRVSTLEQDLLYLRKNGYNTVFIDEIVDYVKNNKPLPEKPIVITADDGCYNNYYYMLPMLEKYDMKATVSIVGYFTENLAVNDSHSPQYSYLTWDDVNLLLKSERIEIGNHSYNMHSLGERKGCMKLCYESEQEYFEKLYSDLGTMQTLIKMNTGVTPIVFAYPFGAQSPESVNVLKELGFEAALNCCEKPNYITQDEECLFNLNRYNRPDWLSTEEFMNRVLQK